MTHPFEHELETTLPASPEQVWAAIATGPGIDSWFMGRNEVEPREGGLAAMDIGDTEQARSPPTSPASASRPAPLAAADGRFMAFEYLIEGRDGGSTVLRVVHSGMLGDDWQDEYDALRRGWPFHLHTLREYLTHFTGRTGVPVFAVSAVGRQPALQVRAALTRGLSLPTPVAVGARAHAEPALPPLDGEVVWSDDERIEVRTADGIYTFHGFAGVVLMFHHLFGPDTDGAEAAWQQWLTGLLG